MRKLFGFLIAAVICLAGRAEAQLPSYQQIASMSAATALTVPSGSAAAVICAETQGVRWRDDGTDPTSSVGQVLAAGQCFSYSRSLAVIKFIQQVSGAILNVTYYGAGGASTPSASPAPAVTVSAGSNVIGKVGIDPSMTGIAAVKSSALESSHVIKASAGSLWKFEVTTGATPGWVLIFNGTSAPTAGGAAIAPEKCYIAPANSTIGDSWNSGPPLTLGTGVVIVFSSSGCLTNTASATVFISAEAQ